MPKLYIIKYDGKPHLGGGSPKFVKAYFDKKVANQVMKAEITKKCREAVLYGNKSDDLYGIPPEERKKLEKERVDELWAKECDNWSVEPYVETED